MDIQQAEAQAREAQIEVALERVRSSAMAMKTSEELNALIGKVFTECTKLDLILDRCIIMIYDTKTLDARWWMANSEVPDQPMNYLVKYHEHLPNLAYIDAWRKRTLKWEYLLEGDVKREWDEFVFSSTELSQLPNFVKDGMRGLNKIYLNSSFYNFGSLTLSSLEPLSDEHFDILLRLAKVFDLTYTRFNDLQIAEAQNKIIQEENERKTKELEDARNLQLAMLPREPPKLPNIDVAVYMKTATEVGGDYYDYHVHPDGTLTVILGDATGHGMMSGMMVSVMKSLFMAGRSNMELKLFFENSNQSIKDMQFGRLMMALIGVQISSEKIIAANAGMPSLFYFRNKSQKAGEFILNNMPLGAMNGIKYSLKEIKHEKGDTLLLMSDGFAELKNENNEMFGYQRALKEFKKVAIQNPDEIIEHLKEEGKLWTNSKDLEDDITFVVIKLK
ncbi:hypothetical protein C0389_02690 [bacterium]|nr:hypothetical protein [bacterium]